MKTLFLYLCLFLTGIGTARAQTIPATYQLDYGQVRYVRSYELPGLTAEQVTARLCSHLPTVKGLGGVRYNGQAFVGSLDDMTVQYQRYGGKWIRIWPALNTPLSGTLLVEPRTGGYTLTLTQLTFDKTSSNRTTANVAFTGNKGQGFTDIGRIRQAMVYLDQFLRDEFQVANVVTGQ